MGDVALRGRVFVFCCGFVLAYAGPALAQTIWAEPVVASVSGNAADEGRGGAQPDVDSFRRQPEQRAGSRVEDAHAQVQEATHPDLSHSKSRLSNKPVPLLKEHTQLPERNPPIFEWNLPFLGPGNIISGFKSPTGAVWQPAFWVFGDVQAGAGVVDPGVGRARQYASGRMDIFGHLQLTPTERVLIGFTPFSRGFDRGTGVVHVEGQGTQFVNALNPNVQTLFFEGDTRQLFPGIDPSDRLGLDFGFSIGKQQIFYQEGIMINANLQAVGITKDTLQFPAIGTQDMRITGVYGWGDIRRGDAQPDPSAYLLGIFTETDFRKNIVTFDMAFVGSDNPKDLVGVRHGGSGFYWGASTTQRFGDINTAFRINTSTALEAKGPGVDNGVLLLAEISRTMPGSTNILYGTFFSAFGNYTSAARNPQVAGPLERVGILFAALQPFALAGSAIPGDANRAIGGALGYQMFFGPRRQLTLELGTKFYTNGDVTGVRESVVALGGQYVQAIDSRTSVQVNTFVLETMERHFGYGASIGTRTRW